ncbi:MAG: hypothetical protein NXH88_05115 [Hyphomonas sp.]|nr:hypothetical protein [Hyphomonas sp.]
MRLFSLLASVTCLAGVGLSPAVAGDYSINQRIDRAFYVEASAGPAVLAVNFDDGRVTDIVANTFWGMQGNAALCWAGVGGSGWLDLCGGATGFVSLGGAEQLVPAALGGGATSTDIQSYGGYVQAKAQLGRVTVAPFAGVRHISAQKATGTSMVGDSGINTLAVFGGSELGIRFMNDRAELGLRGEYGQANGTLPTEQFSYGSGGAFLKVRF